jgi:hypothetical protein
VGLDLIAGLKQKMEEGVELEIGTALN